MRRLDDFVTRIQNKILDETGTRVSKLDIVEAVNEAKDLVVADLVECNEGILAYLSLSETPIHLDIVAGNPRIALPGGVGRIRRVRVLRGSDYITIQERKKGEGAAGLTDPPQVSVLYGDTTYQIVGPFIEFDRQTDTNIPAGVEIDCERSIPDLMMGTADGGSGTTIILPSASIKETGQAPASYEDEKYTGLDIEILSGTGAGKRGTVKSYAGSTRTCAMVAAWGATIDATSVFAMWTPFRRLVDVCDRLIELRARVVVYTDGKMNRDASGIAARYNELQESFMSMLDRMTPGSRAVAPLGGFDIG